MQNVWRRRIIINNSSLQIWNLNVLELFKVWRKYIFKNISLTVQKPGRKTQGIQRHLPSQLRRNQIKNNDHKISTSLAPMETVSFVFPIPSMLPKASGNIDVLGKQNSQFPVGPVTVCCYTCTSQLKKKKKNNEKLFSECQLAQQICCNFKIHDPITCEWKVLLLSNNFALFTVK